MLKLRKGGGKYFLNLLFHGILEVCNSTICVGLVSSKYLLKNP